MNKASEPADVLTHARNEFMQTFADLAVLIPGLSASILITVPAGNDVNATFFTNHDVELAIKLMTTVLQKGKQQNVIVSSKPTGRVPEAS